MRIAFGVVLLIACDGGMTGSDAGRVIDCAGMADGTSCGGSMICVGGACGDSACGDGFVDGAAGEECEDGNTVAFDGCDPGTCTFTCTETADCSDSDPCNGDESCNVDHACLAGAPLEEDALCVLGGEDGTCRMNRCVVPGCPNGFVEGDEECDDDNVIDGDGCDLDCTYSCDLATNCEDGNVCNGIAVCQLADHTCSEGTRLDCGDGDPCTNDVCNPSAGCQHPVALDADMDGYPPESLGPCGTDCDDGDDTVYPGATELCDAIDQNCDGDPGPGSTPVWYVDCDGDGYARPGAASMSQCDEPAPSGCGGGWTAREPSAGESDCDDADAAVRPRGTEVAGDPTDVDEDCDGSALCYADADSDGFRSTVELASADTDCTDPGEARASVMLDCDDSMFTVQPGAAEQCNARDDDCDGMIDDGASCGTCTIASNAGRTYLFCRDSRPWSGARDHCRMFGYDLVSIDSMAEQDFVSSRALLERNEDWWIGLNDQAAEGVFMWTNGAPFSYMHWTAGQPDNNGEQDCVLIADGSVPVETRMSWNDFGCASSQPHVCEIP